MYEVEPLYDPVYCAGNDEYQAKAVRVLKNLGKATNFLEKNKQTRIYKSPAGEETPYIKHVKGQHVLSPEKERQRRDRNKKRRERYAVKDEE